MCHPEYVLIAKNRGCLITKKSNCKTKMGLYLQEKTVAIEMEHMKVKHYSSCIKQCSSCIKLQLFLVFSRN